VLHARRESWALSFWSFPSGVVGSFACLLMSATETDGQTLGGGEGAGSIMSSREASCCSHGFCCFFAAILFDK